MSSRRYRRTIDTPYERDHAASIARVAERGRKPRTLGEYLTWLAARWGEEMPGSRIHTRGVFFGRPDRDIPSALVGGSALGTPADHPSFRRYIEGSPSRIETAALDGETTSDYHFATPLRATLAYLSTRRPDAVDWVVAVARASFDWRAVARRRGFTYGEAEMLLETACYLVWRDYTERPRVEYRDTIPAIERRAEAQ